MFVLMFHHHHQVVQLSAQKGTKHPATAQDQWGNQSIMVDPWAYIGKGLRTSSYAGLMGQCFVLCMDVYIIYMI